MENRAVWSTSYVNDLPDSAFLLVYTDAKGTKQRLFPVKDATGKPDADHIRNALARIPQASTITATQRAEAMAKAKKMSAAHPDIGSGPGKGYEGSAGSGRSQPVPADALGYQERRFPLVMEIREQGDGRTLYGRAVPYHVVGDVGGKYSERFLPGVFSKQLSAAANGFVKLYDSHDARLRGQPHIGKTEMLREQPDGLYGEWRIMDTPAGNGMLTMVREGEITGLSIGFKPGEGGASRKASDGVVERLSGHLDHVALTSEPVYADAGILAVRSQTMPRYAANRERFRLAVTP
jgi:hypothetical protein